MAGFLFSNCLHAPKQLRRLEPLARFLKVRPWAFPAKVFYGLKDRRIQP
jgi:hypothetical protein